MATIWWDAKRRRLTTGDADARQDRPKVPEFELPLTYASGVRLDDLEAALRSITADASTQDALLFAEAELLVVYKVPMLAARHRAQEAVDAYTVADFHSELSIDIEAPLYDGETADALARRVDVILRRNGYSIITASHASGDFGNVASFTIVGPRAITIGAISAMAQSVRRAAARVALADHDSVAIFQEIIATAGDALLGQPESGVFDVKGKPYNLTPPEARLELALDVASFANTTTGGVLVIGASTEKDDARRDVVQSVHGYSGAVGIDPAQYRDVLSGWVYPAIEGIEFESIILDHGRTLFAILVPPQAEAIRPFIVKRSMLKKAKGLSGDFSIPVRRGDAKSYLRAEEIHALIRTGSLRNVILPDGS